MAEQRRRKTRNFILSAAAVGAFVALYGDNRYDGDTSGATAKIWDGSAASATQRDGQMYFCFFNGSGEKVKVEAKLTAGYWMDKSTKKNRTHDEVEFTVEPRAHECGNFHHHDDDGVTFIFAGQEHKIEAVPWRTKKHEKEATEDRLLEALNAAGISHGEPRYSSAGIPGGSPSDPFRAAASPTRALRPASRM